MDKETLKYLVVTCSPEHSLTVGVLRSDFNMVKQVLAWMWKREKYRNRLKWALPFLVCSTSYHNIREFGATIFDFDNIDGQFAYEVLSNITTSAKSTEAKSLADLYFCVLNGSYSNTNPEIRVFFNFLIAPKVSSRLDPFLHWYTESVKKPLAPEQHILLHATAFLLATRDLGPDITPSGYTDDSYMRFYPFPYDPSFRDSVFKSDYVFDYTDEIEVDRKKVESVDLKLLANTLYFSVSDDVCGKDTLTGALKRLRLESCKKGSGIPVNTLIDIWEETKRRFDEEEKRGGCAKDGDGLDEECIEGGKSDILREAQSEDAQEELWEGDEDATSNQEREVWA